MGGDGSLASGGAGVVLTMGTGSDTCTLEFERGSKHADFESMHCEGLSLMRLEKRMEG